MCNTKLVCADVLPHLKLPETVHLLDLSGRAIDIARRPGVRHADIAAALRAAGYVLIESLDEGDHSHFAFGSGAYASAMPARR